MIIINDFIALFFPRTCPACGFNLFSNEKVICTKCLHQLPRTNFHRERDNPVNKIFWGRVNLELATALYFYRKGGKVQHLIHQFKYKGHKEIGRFLGELLGSELMTMDEYKTIDLIIPVPLHKKKLQKRGFNQSEIFAQGLSKSMDVRVISEAVIRTTATSTQTRKSRYKRWENVNEIFELKHPEILAGKHILVADDVITTGATMEACIQAVQQVKDVRVSVVSIGFASH